MMSNQRSSGFQREYAHVLAGRLDEPRRFLQVVAGPRQFGKTTLVEQLLTTSGSPNVYASADEPTLRDTAWLTAQWDRARFMADEAAGAVLALDEDTHAGRPLRVVVLGSAPLLMTRDKRSGGVPRAPSSKF